MASDEVVVLGRLVLPEKIMERGALLARGGRIAAVGAAEEVVRSASPTAEHIELAEGYVTPGFVDLHVHGGDNADFMDGTPEAFETVVAAHLRHGTTAIMPTTTVGSHERLLQALSLTRSAMRGGTKCGARVLGCHFYGPYFGTEAYGCHPAAELRPPVAKEYEAYLEFAEAITNATVAPELPGAEEFTRLCTSRGVRTNIGHSHATFPQVAAAVEWGARHVDHLYCAMSDKTRLRQKVPYPMRGGVLEATLYFDELTTEVIADGRHLSPDLLMLALKIKGADRLALVTDCSRALDCPDGEYLFGPLDAGELFVKKDGVGMMPSLTGLASSVQGMDFMLRTFYEQTGAPLHEVVRMATLTPARIAGKDAEVGSLAVGRCADFLHLDNHLHVRAAWVGGRLVA